MVCRSCIPSTWTSLRNIRIFMRAAIDVRGPLSERLGMPATSIADPSPFRNGWFVSLHSFVYIILSGICNGSPTPNKKGAVA
eukprot:6172701-Amphidinium_carterae.2